MAIRKSGDQKGLAKQLGQLDQQSKLITNLREKPLTDESKSAIRDRLSLISTESGAIVPLLGSVDPQVRSAAERTLFALLEHGLEVSDPALARQVGTLAEKYGLTPDHAPKTSDKHLNDTEFGTVMALVESKVSNEEYAALRLLRPVLTDAQKTVVDTKLTEADRVNTEARLGFFSAERAAVTGATAFPILPYVATGLLAMTGVLAPPVALASSLIGGQAGTAIGEQLQKMAQGQNTEYGGARFDGTQVDNDFSRLRQRAAEGNLQGGVQGLKENVAAEAALVSTLLVQHASDPRSQTAAGKATVTALKGYGQELTRLSTANLSPRDLAQQVSAAQNKLTGAVSEEQAAASLEAPKLPQLATTDADVKTLARANAELGLSLENPTLYRFVKYLKTEYLTGADGKALTTASKPISTNDLAALKRNVGGDASLREFITLEGLDESGVLKLKDVWGENVTVEGKKVDLASLDTALRGRDAGQTKQTEGTWVTRIGLLLGTVIPIAMAFTGVGAIPAVAVALFARLGGAIIGDQLKKAGVREEALSGVDLATRPSVRDEYLLGLETVTSPDFLANAKPNEIAGKLEQQAGVIDSFNRSFQSYMNSPEGPLVLSRYLGYTGFLQDQLEGFATALHDIAKSGAAPTQMRADLQKAYGELLKPGMADNLLADQVTQASSSEGPVGIAATLRARKGFLAAAEDVLNKGGAPTNRALIGPATEIVKNVGMVKRGDRDAVFADRAGELTDPVTKMVKQVTENPDAPIDMKSLKSLVAARQGLDVLADAAIELRSNIKPKRAKEILQDFLALHWQEDLPLLGSLSADQAAKIPDVDDIKVTREPGQPYFTVAGTLPEGGKVVLAVGFDGVPNLNADVVTVNLGKKLLGEVAQHSVERYAELGSGKAVEASSVKRVGDAPNDAGIYDVRVGPSVYRVNVNAIGSVDFTTVQTRPA